MRKSKFTESPMVTTLKHVEGARRVDIWALARAPSPRG
jgi:hypothetical protein